MSAFAATLILVGILNGQPYFLQDTDAYWNAGRVSTEAVFGKAAAGEVPAASLSIPDRAEKDSDVVGGRSVYFGLPVYFAWQVAGWWGVFVAQGVLTAGILVLALNLFWKKISVMDAIAVCGVLLVSGFGFVVAFLMPDFLTPLMLMAATLLTTHWTKMGVAARLVFFATCAFAVMSHMSNLLILLLWITVMTCYHLVIRRLHIHALLSVLGAIAMGFMSILAFNAVTEQKFGKPPIYPPFLLARLVADGSALPAIDRGCRDGRMKVICRFRGKLNQRSDAFLWSGDPDKGVFAVLSGQDQRTLSNEQTMVLRDLIVTDPIRLIGRSAQNAVKQVAVFRLDFHTEINVWNSYMKQLWPEEAERFQSTLQGRSELPWFPLVVIQYIVIAVGTGILVAGFVRHGRSWDESPVVTGIIVGVLANAAICGAISEPLSRYQARVAWLLPLIALMIIIKRRSQPA